MKYKTMYNYTPTPAEVFTLPSMTVPGQSMTIQQMLQRNLQGFEMRMNRNLQWEEEDQDEPLPRIKDLTDLDDVRYKIKTVRDKMLHAEKMRKAKAEKKEASESSGLGDKPE